MPPPESSEQGAVLPQNYLSVASSTRCQVGPVPDFEFWFLCVFGLLFDEGPWIVYSVVTLIVVFFLHSKRVYVFLIGVYIIFFAWNLLLLSVDIICWNWKIYVSFSCVCFGFNLSSLEFEYISSCVDSCCISFLVSAWVGCCRNSLVVCS